MADVLQRGQPVISDALVALWGARFKSYNLVPLARADVEYEVQYLLKRLEEQENNFIKNPQPWRFPQINMLRNMAEKTIDLHKLEKDEIDENLFKDTRKRKETLDELVASIIKDAKKDAHQFSPRVRQSLMDFIAERREKCERIKKQLERTQSRYKPGNIGLVSADCTASAELYLQAFLIVDRLVKLRSYDAAVAVHSFGFKMYHQLIKVVLDNFPRESWSGEAHKRVAQRCAPLLNRFDALGFDDKFDPRVPPVRRSRKEAAAIDTLEHKMHRAYLDLLEFIRSQSPEALREAAREAEKKKKRDQKRLDEYNTLISSHKM